MVLHPNERLLELAQALAAAGVQDLVVGSIASSRHGEYRATNDIDLLADSDTPR